MQKESSHFNAMKHSVSIAINKCDIDHEHVKNKIKIFESIAIQYMANHLFLFRYYRRSLLFTNNI